MPLQSDQTRDLGIAYRASLQALITGYGTEQAWSTLAVTINLALLLAEAGLQQTALPALILAQKALISAKARTPRTNRWGFTGDELTLIKSALIIHDEQIASSTPRQIKTALDEIHQRITDGEVMA